MRIFLFTCILFPFCVIAQDKFKILNGGIGSVPAGVKYKGEMKDAARWKDNAGEQFVIICETGTYKSDNRTEEEMEGNSADVYAYKYSKKNGEMIMDWKIQDFVRDCPFDITAMFVKNTLQVSDLDNNGKAEVWVMYKVTCRSDVSPCNMKIIMYEDQTKHAMRGETKVPATETSSWGGEYKFDEAFEKAPKKFRDFALKLWNDNVMETWGK
jgi:hypothetical protein